jgi:hypothetical protein
MAVRVAEAARASAGEPSDELILSRAAHGASRPISGREAHFISMGLSATLIVLREGKEVRGRCRRIPRDQVAMTAQHQHRFAASRDMQCIDEAPEDALSLRWLAGFGF